MIDFHSHFLSNIDDGANDIDESIQMLNYSKQQGVDTIVSTSHCYPKTPDDIEVFLSCRQESFDALLNSDKLDKALIPNIVLGCEVHLSTDISKFDNIEKLCIQNTNYILLEMPYSDWHESIYEWIYSLTLKGMRPIIAHIDRYFYNEKLFKHLYDLNLIYQVNAISFLNFIQRRKIKRLFANNSAHIIGSDAHNMTTRKSKIKEAFLATEKYFGKDCVTFFNENSEKILKNENIL